MQKKPAFSLIAVCTVDGKIARHPRHMTDWSSKEDKDFLHKKLDEADAVVVGHTTYEVAKEPLSKRNCIVFTRSVPGAVENGTNLAYLNPDEIGIAEYCATHGYKKVAVLGGAQTFSHFLENGLVDEIFLTIEPLVFGEGIGFFGPVPASKGLALELVSAKELNKKGTVLLHYKKRAMG